MKIYTDGMLFRSAKFWGKLFGGHFCADADLCTFARTYLWRILHKSAFLFALGFIALAAITYPIAMLILGTFNIIGKSVDGWGDTLLLIGQFAWLLVGGGLCVVVIVFAAAGIAWLFNRFVVGTGKALAETVVGEFVIGVKNKFCPYIQWVNREKEANENSAVQPPQPQE